MASWPPPTRHDDLRLGRCPRQLKIDPARPRLGERMLHPGEDAHNDQGEREQDQEEKALLVKG